MKLIPILTYLVCLVVMTQAYLALHTQLDSFIQVAYP